MSICCIFIYFMCDEPSHPPHPSCSQLHGEHFFHLCDKWPLGLWELPLETSKNQKNIDERTLRFAFWLFLSFVFTLAPTRTALRSNFYLVLNMFDLNVWIGSYGCCFFFFFLLVLVLFFWQQSQHRYADVSPLGCQRIGSRQLKLLNDF